MGGRIYDPSLITILDRFLQADPLFLLNQSQAPKNLQNYNRYSYVLNNPLTYTDPSGYFFKALTKAAGFGLAGIEGAYVSHKSHELIANSQTLTSVTIAAVGVVTTAFCGPCSIGFTALASANLTYYRTGSMRAALTSGAITGAMSAVFYGIGEAFTIQNCANCYMTEGGKYVSENGKPILTMGARAAKTITHGFAGGVMAAAQGGNFGSAFLAAGVSQAFAPHFISVCND